MIKTLLRGLGPAALGMVALTTAAAAQGYPPYPAQPYPPPPQAYPEQQGYPPPAYPAQRYPGQAYPAPQPQPYPGQAYPAQAYPAQGAQNKPVAASPVCVRLEGQLSALNANPASSTRADQIKQAEDAVGRQQADLDRTLAQARRAGCEGQGFFALFSGLSPRCGPLTSQIQQMRGNLDTMMSNLEQLKSGGSDLDGQRTALISQLAQNNCGSQYTAAAHAAGPQNFFEALLGGGTVVSPNGNGAPAGTYRTVCVRTCDGFYFPISYSTVPARFGDDAQTCQRLCPDAEVTLYTYRNPGEEIEQAVSASGAPYTALPNAFRYRKELVGGCSCRRPGESWAEALRNADDSSTLESGDIIVNEKNEKALTQIPGKPPVQSANAAPAAPAAPDTGNAAATEPNNRKVRIVGPVFMSQH